MSNFEENMVRARSAFSECVKQPLLKLLAVEEILSIEDDAPKSAVSSLLDQSGTSDVLLNYRAQGLVMSAASRISFVAKDWNSTKPPAFSMTLGNAKGGKTGVSELNKLSGAVSAFAKGIPVVLPRFLCMAQVDERGKIPVLLELLAVETIPLIQTIFNRAAVNLPALRNEFSLALNTTSDKTSAQSKSTCVRFGGAERDYAGIRANKQGDSFFFFTREFLDDQALSYRRFTN